MRTRAIPAHHLARIERRFWRYVSVVGDCWLWTGTTRNGYGVTSVYENGVQTRYYAHRVAYELLIGPIPEGMDLHHSETLCRNTLCVNVEKHIEVLTPKQHSMKGNGGAATMRAKTHCPSGHPYSGDNLMVSGKKHGRYCRTCLREKIRRRRALEKAGS